MTSIVLIGGAAATGKTSVVNDLVNRFGAVAVRPSESYMSLAAERQIEASAIFHRVPASDAEDHFIALCSKEKLVVSDIHFAIQPRRDSAHAVGLRVDDIYEEYTATLSDRMLTSLAVNNLLFVLLHAPAQTTWSRATQRDGERRRAATLEDAEREANAERLEFERAVIRSGARCLKLSSFLMTTHELTEAIARAIQG